MARNHAPYECHPSVETLGCPHFAWVWGVDLGPRDPALGKSRFDGPIGHNETVQGLDKTTVSDSIMILTIHNYSILYICIDSVDYHVAQGLCCWRINLSIYTHMFPTLYWIFNHIRWYHGIAISIFYNNERNKTKYRKEINKETYSRNWLVKDSETLQKLPGIHTHHAIQRERIHVRNILNRSVANPLGTRVEQQIWWTWHHCHLPPPIHSNRNIAKQHCPRSQGAWSSTQHACYEISGWLFLLHYLSITTPPLPAHPPTHR